MENNEIKKNTLYLKANIFKNQIENLEVKPYIISIDGVNFKKITKGLKKPYSEDFNNIMASISRSLLNEMQGVVMSFVYGDEIIIIGNPVSEQNLWCKGNSNKIISMISGLSSYFYTQYTNLSPLNSTIGNSVGLFKVNTIKNVTPEQILSYLIWKQDASGRVYGNLGSTVLKIEKKYFSKKLNNVLRKKFEIIPDLNFKLQQKFILDLFK